MRERTVATVIILALAAVGLCAPLSAQQGEVLQARTVVVRELVGSLPPKVPEGALAVLPPKVEEPALVDPSAVQTWSTAVEEAIHTLRPELEVVDRAHLEEILREQRFGDSAYADPRTAAEVGKLVSARMLLLTRIHELRRVDGKVRVSLEAGLVDVETGENLWSRSVQRGIFPTWASVILAIVMLLLVLVVLAMVRARWRRRLVGEAVPRARGALHVDVDGVAGAVSSARERLHRAGSEEGAVAVQRAWNELDPVLDRVRHALPGGSVDRSRIRDLRGATGAARRVAGILSGLRIACAGTAGDDEAGGRLAARMGAAVTDLREALDQYRRFLG